MKNASVKPLLKKSDQDTALLCVQNNILRAIDDHKGVALVLLDLNAAFDIIDRNILPDRF